MSQTRSLNGYAMAGGQFAQDDYFRVSDRVYVPDGDAGTQCASCFQARPAARRHKGPATMSLRSAAVFLACVAVVCGFMVGFKLHARKEISLHISQMYTSMETTRKDNAQLEVEVLSARDSSRVCYIAVNELGMVAAEDTHIQYIYVQEIEQFTKAEEQNENVSAAAELPLQSAQAQLSGSR